MKRVPRLHLVTDDAVLHSDSFRARVARALEVGGDRVAIHLRGPATSGRVLYESGNAIVEDARRSDAPLIVNDRIDVALALGAAGVHLGARSLSVSDARGISGAAMMIGRSIHLGEEIGGQRPDYFLAGPVFETPSHRGRPGVGGRGLEALIGAGAPTPVLGIGGIGAETVSRVLERGAYGVAVVRAVWSVRDTGAAVSDLLDQIEATGLTVSTGRYGEREGTGASDG